MNEETSLAYEIKSGRSAGRADGSWTRQKAEGGLRAHIRKPSRIRLLGSSVVGGAFRHRGIISHWPRRLDAIPSTLWTLAGKHV